MKISGDITEFSTVLIKRAGTGSDRAFREIYNKIAGKMYTLCLRYAASTQDANDLFQDGFVKLFRNLGNFRNEGSFEGWARRIFVTTCLDAIKKRKIDFLQIEAVQDIECGSVSGFDNLSLEDMMRILRKLPDGYRTVINLYIIEGYSHREIGYMLNISENGSKSQLHKARIYLKKILSKQSEQV